MLIGLRDGETTAEFSISSISAIAVSLSTVTNSDRQLYISVK